MTINIDGTNYEIAEGSVYTDNYNETLDSSRILLKQLSSKLNIEPFDVVTLSNGRRMCIDNYICTQTSLNPPIYNYDISLFSETKTLEGIICPSLAITKRKNGNLLSVWDYIDRYVSLYSPKLKVNNSYVNKYTLSSQLDRFKMIDCPEMQWNEPTLREVLNDLMMVDDCIAVVDNDVIGCLDVSQVGTEITDKSSINYIQETQTSDDYVSDLKMFLVNSANNTSKTNNLSPKDCTKLTERIGFRSNESYLLTTENATLQTCLPIWRIFNCKAYGTYNINIGYYADGDPNFHTVNTVEEIDIDLTDYILEYGEWQTKKVLYRAWGVGDVPELNSEYQNTSLYFIRGQRNIFNFNAKVTTSYLFIDTDQYLINIILNSDQIQAKAEFIAERFMDDYLEGRSYEITSVNPTAQTDWKSLTFELDYEPVDECTFLATKKPFKKHTRQVVDNQTNSYIDVKRQGMLEYLKVNRLGNKMYLINARYKAGDTIPSLADTINIDNTTNNKIIFKRELSYYKNYINVNFWATENYVLKDYFTSVKSKIRSWVIVSGQEALRRQELIKFYTNANIPSVNTADMKIPSQDAEWFLQNVNYCAMRFKLADNSYLPTNTEYNGVSYNTNAIEVEFSKHKISNNSIVFTIRMLDNCFNGKYVSNYSGYKGEVEQMGVGYTDNNGEIVGGEIYFYSQYHRNPSTLTDATRGLKPLINIGMTPGGNDGDDLNSANLVAKIPFLCYKDNKEILQISIQFEWNTQANDMFIGVVESE